MYVEFKISEKEYNVLAKALIKERSEDSYYDKNGWDLKESFGRHGLWRPGFTFHMEKFSNEMSSKLTEGLVAYATSRYNAHGVFIDGDSFYAFYEGRRGRVKDLWLLSRQAEVELSAPCKYETQEPSWAWHETKVEAEDRLYLEGCTPAKVLADIPALPQSSLRSQAMKEHFDALPGRVQKAAIAAFGGWREAVVEASCR